MDLLLTGSGTDLPERYTDGLEVATGSLGLIATGKGSCFPAGTYRQ